MIFGESSDLIEPENNKFPSDNWFGELKMISPQEDWIVELEAVLPTAEEKEEEIPPPFKEVRAPLEYSTCADA
jgi:hypothetical protein